MFNIPDCLFPSHLSNRYEGDAERAVTRVFQEAASKAPCCVLIDNMDLLCYSRTAAGASELQKRIVACLLTLMDGLDVPSDRASTTSGASSKGVFVIGTTSRIGDIDPAVRRAGRIDKEIEIGVPSSVDREAILLQLLTRSGARILTSATPSSAMESSNYDLSETSVREVAKLAHGMVGADLLSVVKEAFYLTLKTAGSLTKVLTGHDADASTQIMSTPLKAAPSVPQEVVGVALLDAADEVIGSLASEFAGLDMDEEEDEHTVGAEDKKDDDIVSTEDVAVVVGKAEPLPLRSEETVRMLETADPSKIVTEAALRQAVGKVSPSALREVVIEVPSVKWMDIGGMEGVKQSLREVNKPSFKLVLTGLFFTDLRDFVLRWWSGRCCTPSCLPRWASHLPRGCCSTVLRGAPRPSWPRPSPPRAP